MPNIMYVHTSQPVGISTGSCQGYYVIYTVSRGTQQATQCVCALVGCSNLMQIIIKLYNWVLIPVILGNSHFRGKFKTLNAALARKVHVRFHFPYLLYLQCCWVTPTTVKHNIKTNTQNQQKYFNCSTWLQGTKQKLYIKLYCHQLGNVHMVNCHFLYKGSFVWLETDESMNDTK